eukprot:900486_1
MSLFTIFWITTLHGMKFTFKLRPKCVCCPCPLDSDPEMDTERSVHPKQEIHNDTPNINDSTLYDLFTPNNNDSKLALHDIFTPNFEGDTPMDSSTMYNYPLHTPNHHNHSPMDFPTNQPTHRPLPLTPERVETVATNRYHKPLKEIKNGWFRRFVERHGLYGNKPSSNVTLTNSPRVLRADGPLPSRAFVNLLNNPLSLSRDLFSSPSLLTSTSSSESTLALSLKQLVHAVPRSSKGTHQSKANHSLIVADTEVTILDTITNRSITYYAEQIIETRFGLICKGRIKGDHNATGVLKAMHVFNNSVIQTAAQNEYNVSRVLAQKQLSYAQGELDNVVHITDAKWLESQYTVSMSLYPGTLRDIMDKQLASNVGAIDDSGLPLAMPIVHEHVAIKVTVELLMQCLAGLQQLQKVFDSNFQYHNWSPDNILVTDVGVPVSSDVVYKVCDFGKVKPGQRPFGSEPYMSGVNNPKTSETCDINGMAVMGIEVISVFASFENRIWAALKESIKLAMLWRSIPTMRDHTIQCIARDVMKRHRGYVFQSDIIIEFFVKLAFFVTSDNITCAEFNNFLNESLAIVTSFPRSNFISFV